MHPWFSLVCILFELFGKASEFPLFSRVILVLVPSFVACIKGFKWLSYSAAKFRQFQ